MNNREIVDELASGYDVRSFPPEVIAAYCKNFSHLSRENLLSVLGEQAAEFAGKCIAYRLKIVNDTYEIDRRCAPVMPNGMILKPAKDYKNPLRQKWMKLVPEGTKRLDCLRILARETGVKNILQDIAKEKSIKAPSRKDTYDDTTEQIPF